jgi:hypothetical protein
MKQQLRVWWSHPPHTEIFYISAPGVIEAKMMLGILADYDNHLVSSGIIHDINNVGGLEEFDGSSWIEWESDNGDDIWNHNIQESL